MRLAATVLVALTCALTEAQQDILERFRFTEQVLSDGTNVQQWTTAECTAQSAATPGRPGTAVHMHIPVDHTTGEPNYPIGWPRMYLTIPTDARDWSRWDFLSVWIYADTSRPALPSSPLGMIVRCPDRNTSYSRTLSELRKGQWTHIITPIADLPNPRDCTAVQFYIAEANYTHGDTVDFYIADLKLLAYAEPVILELRPLANLLYADSSALRAQVRVAGLEEGATAELTCRLKCADVVLAEQKLSAKRGLQSVLLQFAGAGLLIGECTLEATIAGNEHVTSVPIRVVSSPWE